MALFESDALSASRVVKLGQARLALKLKKDPNPIRRALLANLNGAGAPYKSGARWHGSSLLLKSQGVPLGHMGVNLSKRKTKKVIHHVRQRLLHEQRKTLQAMLPLRLTGTSGGRGSVHLAVFNQVVSRMIPAYKGY